MTRDGVTRDETHEDDEIASAYLSGASLQQIAAAFGRVYDFVRRRLRRAGVTARSSAEGVHLAKRVRQDVEVTEELIELIDGLLLGDGHLENTKWSARLTLGQTAAHASWLQQVHSIFERNGVLSAVQAHGRPGEMRIRGKWHRRRKSFALRTASYVFLKAMHARWYPKGTKRVPTDVRLTPVSIAHWFFGDGTVAGHGYRAYFCTDGFPIVDVRRLARRLEARFQWRPLLDQRNRILLCKVNDRVSLAGMLRIARVPHCFRHKLQLRLRDHRLQIVGDVEDRLRDFAPARVGVRQNCERVGAAEEQCIQRL